MKMVWGKVLLDIWCFQRLITMQMVMETLTKLYESNRTDLQRAIKKNYILGFNEWEEIEKKPAQTVTVLMAFIRYLARNDSMLEEMVQDFVSNGNLADMWKADMYMESLKKKYGRSVFVRSINNARPD